MKTDTVGTILCFNLILKSIFLNSWEMYLKFNSFENKHFIKFANQYASLNVLFKEDNDDKWEVWRLNLCIKNMRYKSEYLHFG